LAPTQKTAPHAEYGLSRRRRRDVGFRLGFALGESLLSFGFALLNPLRFGLLALDGGAETGEEYGSQVNVFSLVSPIASAYKSMLVRSGTMVSIAYSFFNAHSRAVNQTSVNDEDFYDAWAHGLHYLFTSS